MKKNMSITKNKLVRIYSDRTEDVKIDELNKLPVHAIDITCYGLVQRTCEVELEIGVLSQQHVGEILM